MIKKIIKIVLVALLSIISLIVIILFATLRIVDNTPYFKTDYYTETINNLDNQFKSNKTVYGQIEAGFGKASITPTLTLGEEDPFSGVFKKVPMSGFGDRKGPASGTHDSIFVKAAALKVNNQMVIVVSADLLIIPPHVADSVSEMLKRETGISRGQIFFGATHTHSSIGATTPKWVGEKFSGGFNPDIVMFLSHRFKEAIVKAIADVKPAVLGTAEIKVPELVRNRMSREAGRLNDNFTCLSVQQKDGRKAIIGTFAAHSTTLGESNLLFSGDFPGYWQRKIEEEYADVGIYFAGTLGSHSHRGVGEGFERPKHMGESLAVKLIESQPNYQVSDSTSLFFFTIPFRTTTMQFRVSKNLYLAPFVSHELIPESDVCYLQGMKLGNLIWITVPFELSGEIAIDVKNALKLKGFNSMFTSFNGDYLGYVTPSKYYNDKTYESYLMGWYGPSMGGYVTHLLFKACEGLTGERL